VLSAKRNELYISNIDIVSDCAVHSASFRVAFETPTYGLIHKLQYLPSMITPLFCLTLLHVSAVTTGQHQALSTSYKTLVYVKVFVFASSQ
jgi:hypothetical protein